MIGLFLLALIIAGALCAIQGLTIRKRLKKSIYWKSIPKGTIFYGYSFPVALVFISEKLWGKPSFTILSILAVILFIYLVIALNNDLKTKRLGETQEVLPNDVRKDVVTFCALTPFITAYAFLLLYIVIDSLIGIEEQLKNRGKK